MHVISAAASLLSFHLSGVPQCSQDSIKLADYKLQSDVTHEVPKVLLSITVCMVAENCFQDHLRLLLVTHVSEVNRC